MKKKRKFNSSALGKPVLILNADYKPLSKYPLSLNNMKKTLKSILKNRVSVVEEYDDIIITEKTEIRLPKVVVLKNYVNVNHKPKFSRNNIYLRDNYTCQYCGRRFRDEDLTFDHVIPRCKGGKTEWDNIVTCCRECNGKKGGRSLEESKFKLLSVPKIPSIGQLERNSEQFKHKWKDNWGDYIE